MTWTVVIHPLVVAEDLSKLDHAARQKILKAIRKKLQTDPEQFGEPLRGAFAGFRKLRVGEYRIVYSVKKTRVVVHVLKIGIRRDFQVYEEFIQRMPKILDEV